MTAIGAATNEGDEPDMTADLDIIQSASLWLELYGQNAIAEARRLAAEMETRGDSEGAASWQWIIVAIDELQRNVPVLPS